MKKENYIEPRVQIVVDECQDLFAASNFIDVCLEEVEEEEW